MTKYEPIGKYLKNSKKKSETLTYKKIEDILGFKLPKSYHDHRAPWANVDRAPASAWLDAGWEVRGVKLGKSVTFKKVAKKAVREPQAASSKRTTKKAAARVKKGRQGKKAAKIPAVSMKRPEVKSEPITEYIPKLIKDFHQLKVEGIITDREFKQKKSELLKRV